MKKILMRFLMLTISSLYFCVSAFALDTYTIDPSHSYVMWHISHFGFSNPSGKWPAKGTLFLDKTKPQNSKVTATIDMNQLVTGIPKLDEHLKSQDFFDVAAFPTATFVSDKVEMIDNTKAKIYGTLTLHGVTKPIILNATLNKIGINPINNKQTIGFSATVNLKRSDFGINYGLPGLGDEVKLYIEIEAFSENK